MKEINWDDVQSYFDQTLANYKEIPFSSAWFVLQQLERLGMRLKSGERTESLAEEIYAME